MKPKLKILLLKALHVVCWIICFLCMCKFLESRNHLFLLFSALFFCAFAWLFDFTSDLEIKFLVEKNSGNSEKVKSLFERNKKLHMKRFFPLFIFCCSLLFGLAGSIKIHWPLGFLIIIISFIISIYWLDRISDERNKIKEAIWQ